MYTRAGDGECTADRSYETLTIDDCRKEASSDLVIALLLSDNSLAANPRRNSTTITNIGQIILERKALSLASAKLLTAEL